jgi:hypothetical protein
MSQFLSDDGPTAALSLIRERSDHHAAAKPAIASQREKLAYLAGMLPELADMAKALQCETLAGLLQVASLEAELRCASKR